MGETDRRHGDQAVVLTLGETAQCSSRLREAMDAPAEADRLIEAFEYFRAKLQTLRERPGRHPGHWAEMSRAKMADEIGRRLGDPANAEIMRALYSQASRRTHPGRRMEAWAAIESGEDAGQLERNEKPLRYAAGTATMAVRWASAALDRQPGVQPPKS